MSAIESYLCIDCKVIGEGEENEYCTLTSFVIIFSAFLKVFSITRMVNFKTFTCIRHYPFTLFVTIVNSDVIAGPPLPFCPIICGMMTQSRNKIGICSKAC